MKTDEILSEFDGFLEKGETDRAEIFLRGMLAKACDESDSAAALPLMNELIGFYRSSGRLREAILLAEQALTLCRTDLPGEEDAYATTLLNSATAYDLAGQTEKALGMFREAEAIFQRILPESDYRCAGLYNNMGTACFHNGNDEEAIRCYCRAAEIVDRLPERRRESVITHANLSALFLSFGQWSRAKQELNQAETRLLPDEKNGDLAISLRELRRKIPRSSLI